jgi:hypothetical protein
MIQPIGLSGMNIEIIRLKIVRCFKSVFQSLTSENILPALFEKNIIYGKDIPNDIANAHQTLHGIPSSG